MTNPRQTIRRCPKCGRLTDSVTCCYVKGPPMFPQMDDYTITEPCEVVMVDALLSEAAIKANLHEQWGPWCGGGERRYSPDQLRAAEAGIRAALDAAGVDA